MYGYARVSSIDQDLSVQRAALKAAGCSVIRAEKASGSSRKGRTELETLMEFLRSGDTLVVTRIDRLARSVRDLQNIVHELQEKGVHLKATEQPIDTSTSAGKAFLGMLAVSSASSKPTCGASDRWTASTLLRRGASTRAAHRPSTLPRSGGCWTRAWELQRSLSA